MLPAMNFNILLLSDSQRFFPTHQLAFPLQICRLLNVRDERLLEINYAASEDYGDHILCPF